MKRILKIINVDFDMLTKFDWDNVLIIDGDEGVGKSHLGLHLFDYWYNLLGLLNTEKIKFIALDIIDFVTGLRDLLQYYMIMYDESGELSNLRMMNKFNYAITQAYQVIRGENLFTILILPSVFDLNPFFTARRARGLIHVYKRGKLAFWSKNKLRQLIDVNRYYKRKSVWRVRPLFKDTYPKYRGVLKNVYDLKKQKKMSEARLKLYNDLFEEEEKNKELILMNRAKEIIGVKKTAAIWDVTPRTVYNRLENFIP